MTAPQPIILVCEDSDEDYDTLVEATRRSGLAVDIQRVLNGDACMNLLRREDRKYVLPAVLILDLNTPGSNGRETLKEIKADRLLQLLPVVICTTSADRRDLEYCYRWGANAYHVKPFQYLDHVNMLLSVLDYWVLQVHSVALR